MDDLFLKGCNKCAYYQHKSEILCLQEAYCEVCKTRWKYIGGNCWVINKKFFAKNQDGANDFQYYCPT